MLCSSCSSKIRPVVAWDIDGTIAVYHDHFLDFAYRYLNIEPSLPGSYLGEQDLATFLGVSKETYRGVKLAYRQGGNKRLMPVFEGAKEALNIVRASGAEIWITTTRPYLRHDSTDPDTREWLRRHNIQYDGLLYDEDKFMRLIEAVDKERVVAVIDDLETNINRARQLGLWAIQVYRPHNVYGRTDGGSSNLMLMAQGVADMVDRWYQQHGGRK
jgi:hypothetical protein